MSKPKKAREKSDTKGKSTTTGKQTRTLVMGVLVFVAIAAVSIYILFMPGTGSSPAGTVGINGTGTGAAAVTGNSVSVYYTGMFTNGTVFDSNVNGTPITFTIGSHQVIPGFENALVGMMAGQTRTVNIPVDQAYGPYNPENIYVLNRTGTLATMNLTEGGILTYRDPSTNAMAAVKILNFTPDTVTIDANNPLAGQALTFIIQLVSIN
ncbi:MAG: FKBP-type peptidyl-prolyl cis-trans isomerase [Methanoregula sp.]|jgi:peptidylprolyl isomerase|nr:FKBP-type peptidyl-prolyl cis-trans isomerase [Methanoregula sp.]